MMLRNILAIGLLTSVLAGCQTTQQASEALQSRWIGQSADSFFVANGPPESEFMRDTGGVIYTWRGGETTTTLPAQWQTQPAPQAPGAPRSSFSRPSYPVLIRPEQRRHHYCEAQISTGASGMIESIRINRDTVGAGLSFSRCGELFSQ